MCVLQPFLKIETSKKYHCTAILKLNNHLTDYNTHSIRLFFNIVKIG